LDPSVSVAALRTVLVIIDQMQISGHEPGGDAAGAKCRS
jgi:hypothetical protein